MYAFFADLVAEWIEELPTRRVAGLSLAVYQAAEVGILAHMLRGLPLVHSVR